MSNVALNSKTRFTIRVAAAITGNNPWACGYREYHGTYRYLASRMRQYRHEHGGNIVVEWYADGVHVASGAKPIEFDTDPEINPGSLPRFKK